MREEYDGKIQELLHKYEQEQESHAQLRARLDEQQKGDARISSAQLLLRERLRQLQQAMVGGEKVNDPLLKQKRAQRKELAEARRLAIQQALRQVDDDEQLLVRAYGDLTEQLRQRTLLLKQTRRRLRDLEHEVTDLQMEFQEERSDYLETIRRLQRALRLHSQLLDKIQPLVRRDVNFADLAWVRSRAFWSEEQNCWQLPEVQFLHTRLPPTQSADAFSYAAGGQDSEQDLSENASRLSPPDDPADKFLKRLEANQNLAANYFKPKRIGKLLHHVQSFMGKYMSTLCPHRVHTIRH